MTAQLLYFHGVSNHALATRCHRCQGRVAVGTGFVRLFVVVDLGRLTYHEGCLLDVVREDPLAVARACRACFPAHRFDEEQVARLLRDLSSTLSESWVAALASCDARLAALEARLRATEMRLPQHDRATATARVPLAVDEVSMTCVVGPDPVGSPCLVCRERDADDRSDARHVAFRTRDDDVCWVHAACVFACTTVVGDASESRHNPCRLFYLVATRFRHARTPFADVVLQAFAWCLGSRFATEDLDRLSSCEPDLYEVLRCVSETNRLTSAAQRALDRIASREPLVPRESGREDEKKAHDVRGQNK